MTNFMSLMDIDTLSDERGEYISSGEIDGNVTVVSSEGIDTIESYSVDVSYYYCCCIVNSLFLFVVFVIITSFVL